MTLLYSVEQFFRFFKRIPYTASEIAEVGKENATLVRKKPGSATVRKIVGHTIEAIQMLWNRLIFTCCCPNVFRVFYDKRVRQKANSVQVTLLQSHLRSSFVSEYTLTGVMEATLRGKSLPSGGPLIKSPAPIQPENTQDTQDTEVSSVSEDEP